MRFWRGLRVMAEAAIKQPQSEKEHIMSKNQPIDKIRFGRLAVTIWENTSQEGDSFHSFSLERTYTDAEGKPQSSNSFRRSDLLTLAEALRKAHNRAFEIVVSDA